MSRSPAKATPAQRKRYPCDLPGCELESQEPIDASLYVALNYKDLPEILEDYDENYRILEHDSVLAHLAGRFNLPPARDFLHLMMSYESAHPEEVKRINQIKARILKSRGLIPPQTATERLLGLVNR